jgi:predicted transcriptional regulator of viral defense system
LQGHTAKVSAPGVVNLGQPQFALIGTASFKPGALVTAAAEPYVAYLSGWSALRLHERIQQLPQTQFAVTLGRPGEVKMAGERIDLHRIKPELFGGYAYDVRAEGFVASPEKAVFDLAYLAAMNRSRVSGSLPETNLQGLRWSEVQKWLRRIPTPRVRAAVKDALKTIRKQHANITD